METKDLPFGVYGAQKKEKPNLTLGILKDNITGYLYSHKDLFDLRKKNIKQTSNKFHLTERLQEMLDAISVKIGYSVDEINNFLKTEGKTLFGLAVEVKIEIFGPPSFEPEDSHFIPASDSASAEVKIKKNKKYEDWVDYMSLAANDDTNKD